MYDIIVVGGGPAGMTAALYARRNNKSVLVLEKNGFGGQITYSPKVENWPGTKQMSGVEFADRLLDQILDQGADTEVERVVGLRRDGSLWHVITEEGGDYAARSVILATGVKHRMLGLPGETELLGSGISFCAVCDGDFYADKKVCVAGGGNSALQEALLLAEKCSEVIVLQDLEKCTGEQRLQDILFKRPNVRLMTGVHITALLQDNGSLTGLTIRHDSGEIQEIACDGLFIAIGLIPRNEAFSPFADLNAFGYFDSDERCLTRTPGVFVAGDCRGKTVRQLATAIADGASAALAACRFINEW